MPLALVVGDKGNHQPGEQILTGSSKTLIAGKQAAFVGSKVADHPYGDDDHKNITLKQSNTSGKTVISGKVACASGAKGSCTPPDTFTASTTKKTFLN